MTERSKRIEAAFWEFHWNNPHVADRLAALARELKAVGHRRIGMKMLFERLRWEHALRTTGTFKLDNSFTALYARLLMDKHADLAGVFAIRRLHSADEPFGHQPSQPSGHVVPPRTPAAYDAMEEAA